MVGRGERRGMIYVNQGSLIGLGAILLGLLEVFAACPSKLCRGGTCTE